MFCAKCIYGIVMAKNFKSNIYQSLNSIQELPVYM